jgi:plastocyanin
MAHALNLCAGGADQFRVVDSPSGLIGAHVRRLFPAVLTVALLAIAAPAANAQALPGAHISADQIQQPADYPGIQHLQFKYGPIDIAPGQNTIEFHPNRLKPDLPGFITRFKPDLVYADDGSVPPVDVIHLHHGVWLSNGYPLFAAGEEKTIFNFPQGYGLPYDPNDNWIMNYMIHNLTPVPTKVYVTYDLDFVPSSEPAAQDITPLHPQWMDVSGIRPYPVFDAYKGSGTKGRFTFPDQARGAQKSSIGANHEWTVPRDLTLIWTEGHLHPGGLYNDITVTRSGVTKTVFRSEAKYFEPAGAVSWDVSMTVSKPEWKIALQAGDKVNVHTTYDTRNASWYESMGIMDTFWADGHQPGSVDPFTSPVDITGELTHGHLPENDNHGGDPQRNLPDARKLLSGVATTKVAIRDYVYGRGDFQLSGKKGRPPVVKRGRSITFANYDATLGMTPQKSAYHTITACKAPCTGSTGIAYPLANAKIQFDSGELGYGPSILGTKATPAANRNTWKTPKTLPVGTYTYFCRIHPFMRGSFRVVK